MFEARNSSGIYPSTTHPVPPAGSRVKSGVCSMEGEDGRVALVEKA